MTAHAGLITRATTDERDTAAVAALVAAGAGALAAVLATAAASHTYDPGLYAVIRRSTYAEAVPVLLRHADADAPGFVGAVFHALARSGPEALGVVLDALTDPTRFPTSRAAASEALYGIDAPGVAEALRDVLAEQAAEPDNPEWPTLLVHTATALATLGDHGGAPALYTLLESEEDTARALAAEAFRIVVDDETYVRLAPLAGDPGVETRRAVIDPLYTLGTRTAAETLLRMASTDPDRIARGNALVRFADIMGLVVGGPEDLSFAQGEWHEHGRELDDDTCHRFREPITLAALLDDFAESTWRRQNHAEELRLLTGVDVPRAYEDGGAAAVPEALAGLAFEPGRLYRWGRVRPMPRAA